MLTTTAVLLALAQAPRRLTLSSPVAPAAVVLEQMGQAAGAKLKAEGSVLNDFVFVRFSGTPLETAMERVAKTLNATWTKLPDDSYVLKRTGAQEALDNAPSPALLKSIAKGLDELHLAPFGPKEIAEFTKNFGSNGEGSAPGRDIAPDVPMRSGRLATRSLDLRPISRLAIRLAKSLGARELASLPSGDKVWYAANPTRWQRGLGPAHAEAVRLYLNEEALYQRALQAAQGEVWSNINPGAPVQVGVRVARTGQSLEFNVYVSQGSAALQDSESLSINADGDTRSEKREATDDLTKLKDKVKLSPPVLEYYDSTNTEVETPKFSSGAWMWQWMLLNPEGRDILDLSCSDVLNQTAEVLGKDMVALVPEGLAYSFIYGYEAPLQPLGDLWKSAESAIDGVAVSTADGYVSIRPVEPGMSRPRIDRKAMAAFATHRAQGPTRPDGLASFMATLPTPTAYDTADSVLRFLVADSTDGMEPEQADMVRFYAQMTPTQRQAAARGGWQARIDDLPGGMRRHIERVLFADDSVLRPASVPAVLDSHPEYDDVELLTAHASFCLGNGWPFGSAVRVTSVRKESIYVRQGSGGDFTTRPVNLETAAMEADSASYAQEDSQLVTLFGVSWLTTMTMTLDFPGIGSCEVEFAFSELSPDTSFFPADRLPGPLGKALGEAIATRRSGDQGGGGGGPDIPPTLAGARRR